MQSGARPEERGIIWLASYPRSGNTWLRNFVNNLLGILHGQPQGSINALKHSTVWDVDPRYYRRILGRPPSEKYRREVAAARARVQELIASQANGRIFVKTHTAALKVDGALAINWKVAAGAVYIVRNPLDVVCSMAPHFGIPVEKAVDRLCQRDFRTGNSPKHASETYGSWSQHVASWTANTLPVEPHVMRYEDMVERPAETFGAFARFAGRGVDDAQIADAIELSTFERLREQEREQGYRERPKISSDGFFRKGRVGQWRETLPTTLVQRIVAEHGAQMGRFGYLPDTALEALAEGRAADELRRL